jgi:predicted O-methyltransferase YrrM
MDTAYVFDFPYERIELEYKHKTHDAISKSVYNAFSVKKQKVLEYNPTDTYIQKIMNLGHKIDDTNYTVSMVKNGKCGYLRYTGEHKDEEPNEGRYEDMNYTVFHGNTTIGDTRVQFGLFLDTELSPYLYNRVKDLSYCDREIFMHKYNLKTLSLLGDYLEIGGNFVHEFMIVCKSFQLEYMYLLTFMFKRVVFMDGLRVCCYEFLGNAYITQPEIIKLIHTPFTIINKGNDPVELTNYLEDVYQYYSKVYGYLLKGDIDKYLDNIAFSIYKKVNSISSAFVKNEMYKLIIDVLKRTYMDEKITKISTSIKSHEGNFIGDIIQRYHCKSCLEIGMGFGISAMYILSYSYTTLISIDPVQSTEWNNRGIKLLKMMGLTSRHHLMKANSFNALPALLKTHKFDFIFIDGLRTFDDTLNDFFYSVKLLNTPGIVIIDNALHPAVNKCIKYIETNYPQCRRLISPATMGCFKNMKDADEEDIYVNF